MEQSKMLGFQIRTLSNMLGRYMWNHGHCRMMENVTGSNGWILGYLAHNEGRDIFQRDLEEEFSVRR
ncbi:MAG: MarR family transcriptional regulator, partial [Butyricicoccaceae bacterium]